MTTYWTVVVMVIGAALLVLLAVWHHLEPTGRQRERRWVALGNAFTPGPGSASWASAVLPSRPAEGIDLTSPGAGIADVLAGQLGPALAARPSVAVIWVGAADFLHGRPLVAFVRDLSTVIGRLQRQGCAVLVVEVSGATLAGPETGPLRARSITRTLGEWQSGIRETSRATGARLVPVGRGSLGAPAIRVAGPLVTMDAIVLERVGQALRGPIDEALGDGGSWSVAADGGDEPADPVVRERLGLPPVR